VDRGKLGEAEKMYLRALEGYEKAVGPRDTLTFIPVLNTIWGLASLFDRQDKVAEAGAMHSKALSGYHKVFGNDHPRCQTLREKLNKASLAAEIESVQARSQPQTIANSSAGGKSSTSKRHKMLRRLGLKRDLNMR